MQVLIFVMKSRFETVGCDMEQHASEFEPHHCWSYTLEGRIPPRNLCKDILRRLLRFSNSGCWRSEEPCCQENEHRGPL